MRTVIDIDDASLEAAKKVLGTTTKVETVNRALAEVANREVRLSFLAHLDVARAHGAPATSTFPKAARSARPSSSGP